MEDKTPKDGRVIILLLFISCLLGISIAVDYQLLSRFVKTANPSCAQLDVDDRAVLALKECSSGSYFQSAKNVPVAYRPLYFKPIPINLAGKEMLETVKGIGPAMAERILTYRQLFGPIKGAEDIQNISGIGSKRSSIFSTAFTFEESRETRNN